MKKKNSFVSWYNTTQQAPNSQRQICPACGKVCYSYKDARIIINTCKHRKVTRSKPLREYMCKDCGSYHLTSKKVKFSKK